MAKNANLHTAKVEKNDEFYTRYEDIEKEVMNYKEQFEGKIVLCNCDDPTWSNFWKFFHQNFFLFKLKKLISTHYESEGSSYAQIFDGEKDDIIPLTIDEANTIAGDFSLFEMFNSNKSNGDFRSAECLKYLEEADIVVTNPPFSLFREFIATLTRYDKKFLVVGNQNAITYKEIFPLIKENKMWLGYGFSGNVGFFTSPYEDTAMSSQHKEGLIRVSGVMWFTNMDNKKRHENIELRKEYNENDYPKYDNYNAINVDKTCDIPCDYYGTMGVPITFLDKFNPEQFEVIGVSSKENCGEVERLHDNSYYNGYTRGKVKTRIESNMPILSTDKSGGTECRKEGCKSVYQLYWRIFIRRIVK